MFQDAGHLGEANILGILAEALSAYIQAVLPDETPLIAADAAVKHRKIQNR